MRLAHCSDLHLLSLDGARALDYLNKRWIGRMNLITSRSRHYHTAAFDDMVADLNAQGVDHIICTGDVTNLALPGEFRYARERFDRLTLGTTGVTVADPDGRGVGSVGRDRQVAARAGRDHRLVEALLERGGQRVEVGVALVAV